MRSSSSVVTPGAMWRPTSAIACAAIRPATRIRSIGLGVLDLAARCNGAGAGRPTYSGRGIEAGTGRDGDITAGGRGSASHQCTNRPGALVTCAGTRRGPLPGGNGPRRSASGSGDQDFLAVRFAAPFLAAARRTAVLRAVVLAAFLPAARRTAVLRAVVFAAFLPAALRTAVLRAVVFAAFFAAVLRVVVFLAVRFAAVLRVAFLAVRFAAVLLAATSSPCASPLTSWPCCASRLSSALSFSLSTSWLLTSSPSTCELSTSWLLQALVPPCWVRTTPTSSRLHINDCTACAQQPASSAFHFATCHVVTARVLALFSLVRALHRRSYARRTT